MEEEQARLKSYVLKYENELLKNESKVAELNLQVQRLEVPESALFPEVTLQKLQSRSLTASNWNESSEDESTEPYFEEYLQASP